MISILFGKSIIRFHSHLFVNNLYSKKYSHLNCFRLLYEIPLIFTIHFIQKRKLFKLYCYEKNIFKYYNGLYHY